MGRGTDDGRRIIPFGHRWPFAPLTARRDWLDRLDRYLNVLMSEERRMHAIAFETPSDLPALIVTRRFDAPLTLVWRAFTAPEHVIRWWGPASRSPIVRIEALDLRPGGAWRFVCRHTRSGAELAFHGHYLVVAPMHRIVNSFGLEGAFAADETAPEEHVFSESDGVTHYRSTVVLPSFAARQAMLDTGMEGGARESLTQLGELVAKLTREQV